MKASTLTALTAAIAMTPVDLKILTFLGTLGPLTSARLTDGLGVNPAYVSQRTSFMLDAGLIERTPVATRPGSPLVRSGWKVSPKIEAGLAALSAKFDTTVIDAMVAQLPAGD